MFDWITRWSLSNRLLTVTAYVIALVVGVFAVLQVTMDVLPEFAPPR